MTIYDQALELSLNISMRLGASEFSPSLEISKDAVTETELSFIITDKNTMIKESNDLVTDFPAEYGIIDSDNYSNARFNPNAISYITDFSNIIKFAEAADQAPFCFDFRENKKNPSIIWWDDAYWVRICDNASEFIQLFMKT